MYESKRENSRRGNTHKIEKKIDDDAMMVLHRRKQTRYIHTITAGSMDEGDEWANVWLLILTTIVFFSLTLFFSSSLLLILCT